MPEEVLDANVAGEGFFQSELGVSLIEIVGNVFQFALEFVDSAVQVFKGFAFDNGWTELQVGGVIVGIGLLFFLTKTNWAGNALDQASVIGMAIIAIALALIIFGVIK